MKNMKHGKSLPGKILAFMGLAFLLTAAFSLSASANSAQSYWTGTAASGAVVTGEACPVVVEHEALTFDIQEFPQMYYRKISEYLSYDSSVTAEYTFYNPSGYTAKITMVFPFGMVPSYGYVYDQETGERYFNADTEKYRITVNGNEVRRTLRHTLSYEGARFDLEKDMALLHDGYMEDGFYTPDTPVTRFTYVPHGVDTETWSAACAAFILSADPSVTKVLLEQQSGGEMLDEAVRIGSWVRDGPFVVDVIGKPLPEMPEWKFYENGAYEKEIEGTMELVRTEVITLKDLALTGYDENSGILEHDWYNAFTESLKNSQWIYGAFSGPLFSFDLSDRLMRWYEYQVTLKPGERIVNTVTAPIYPSFNIRYEPTVYEYLYLLSPAGTWAEFGALDIAVRTPYYMISSGPEGFERTDGGYVCRLEGLPDEELTFTLCLEPDPAAPLSDRLPLLFLPALAASAAAVILFRILRKKKKLTKK